MEKTDNDIKVHVFVCTNKKNGKACCADEHGEELRAELKEWSRENKEWKKKIRVNSSGCLDRCNEGVAIAIYPQNEWLVNVHGRKDVDQVKKYITDLMNVELAKESPSNNT